MHETATRSLEIIFTSALSKAFPLLENPQEWVAITASTQEQFGHYQLNSAMRLAKPLKLPPRTIAEKLIDSLSLNDMIGKLEVAGPGFINIFLTPSYLSSKVQEMAFSPRLAVKCPKELRVIVDFSSPNIAKELHVGHLRSTIIGDSISRILEFLGHDVLRLNHIGDWGTQFGMLIAHMGEACPGVLKEQKAVDLPFLVSLYREARARFEEDEAFKKRAQKQVSLLQGGNEESLQAWRLLCQISETAYQEIYDLLDVHLTARGESFYNPFLKPLVEKLLKEQVAVHSDGCACIFPPGFQNKEGAPLPLIIQKSDGGFTYATTDLAALEHRVQKEKAERILYVTDAGQHTHFQMVFKAAETAKLYDPKKTSLEHVPFGLVLGSDGKKFKTRSGDTERLIDLLTTAISKAYEIIEERCQDLSEEEKKQLARTLGIGAVKYADLSTSRTSDYTFSYERMLKFEGNTAAYLMYSHVRIAGIKRKLEKPLEEYGEIKEIALKHPAEIALGLHLIRFEETLEQVAKDLFPNHLCEYLYELSEKFNAFFRDCRVLGSQEQASRLWLCDTTQRVLQQGLALLGVQAPLKM